MSVCLIGVDCATDPKKRGVAIAHYESGKCTVSKISTGLNDAQIADLVIQSNQEYGHVLLALDAPLGWPSDLGVTLANHSAGQPLNLPSNKLFRRETDNFIKKTYAKQPLDVGADRIARTAHSALSLLSNNSEVLGGSIPLAWNHNFSGVAAIEVYPAATLVSYGLPASGYKKVADQSVRQKIISGLQQYLSIPNIEPMLHNADALDAVICVLSGKDFLDGNTFEPVNQETAEKEGWIWVRRPDQREAGF